MMPPNLWGQILFFARLKPYEDTQTVPGDVILRGHSRKNQDLTPPGAEAISGFPQLRFTTTVREPGYR
jgi:hypothetical protein